MFLYGFKYLSKMIRLLLATFNLTNIESQKRCFNYRNLQALHILENSSKQHRVRFKDIVF